MEQVRYFLESQRAYFRVLATSEDNPKSTEVDSRLGFNCLLPSLRTQQEVINQITRSKMNLLMQEICIDTV